VNLVAVRLAFADTRPATSKSVGAAGVGPLDVDMLPAYYGLVNMTIVVRR
jgi:hypothetical protein